MGKRSNGEGSIYKRKDGRWCSSYFDEQYNRHYMYGKTQAEVKKKLKEKMDSGVIKIKGKTYLLQEWVLEFLEKYKVNELKITTYQSYLITYRKHIQGSSVGKKKIDKLKSLDLQNFYNKKIKDGYNSKTVRIINVIINEALEMAYRQRLILENPNRFTTIPKKVRYEAAVLSEEEVKRIIAETREESLYPIVVTTLGTGMRKGEVMALRWQDIDFEEKKIYVRHNLCRVEEPEPDVKGHRRVTYKLLEPKNKKSMRVIPMLDEVYFALMEQKRRQDIEKEQYIEIYEDRGFVFANPTGNYLPQRGFMDDYYAFLRKYGIKKVRFHDLRHTFASLLIESDVSMKVVQELLGHSTITTSMDIYTHVSQKKKVQEIRKLPLSHPKQLERNSENL